MHKILKRTYISFQLSPILGIGEFHYILLTSKKILPENSKTKSKKNRLEFYVKNAVPYCMSVGFLKKSFLSELACFMYLR